VQNIGLVSVLWRVECVQRARQEPSRLQATRQARQQRQRDERLSAMAQRTCIVSTITEKR
jgi:hypothetical protein